MWLFDVLYFPAAWSQQVNGPLYQYVALVLQASQAHNVTAPGCRKYNVPSGNITIENPMDTFYPNVITYSQFAISGADNFNDYNTTVKDVFDIVVKTTREVSPTCKISVIQLCLC